MSTPKLSAYMITFNNARTVERALRSVRSWVDEIVVVDSFSTDETPEIAKKYADRFLQRQWPGFRDQYQFAADQCAADWLIFIDADEEVSPRLADEIQTELRRNAERPDSARIRGYYGHRRTWYLGRWIRHGGWIPDYEMRLYHRNHGRWEGGLHAKIEVHGKTAHLRHFYYHYTYAGISDQILTIDKYSTVAAGDMENAGRRFVLFRLIADPPARFVRDYFLKLGFLDGLPGLIIAVNSAFHVFAKHAKLWERLAAPPALPPEDAPPPE